MFMIYSARLFFFYGHTVVSKILLTYLSRPYFRHVESTQCSILTLVRPTEVKFKSDVKVFSPKGMFPHQHRILSIKLDAVTVSKVFFLSAAQSIYQEAQSISYWLRVWKKTYPIKENHLLISYKCRSFYAII